jgi:hypothetical protein
MGFIRAQATDLGGALRPVKYEAPLDAGGRQAIGYLRPSGATYIHPMYAFAKQVGAPEDSIRAAHRGVDGQGTEYVSDQRWIYDTQEAAQLEREDPEHFVRVEG